MIRAIPMMAGIRAGRIAPVFIRIPIPSNIPAMPNKMDSFIMDLIRCFGL